MNGIDVGNLPSWSVESQVLFNCYCLWSI